MIDRPHNRRIRAKTYAAPVFLLALFLLVGPVRGQTQCGIADSISYPIDTTAFTLVQDFAAPSPRHQGRYHTGEDWYGGRGSSAGQPVRAIARGRVTYSAPLGWGRDGGVVIIEHTFPDGTVAYSQYGHMEQTATVNFPARLACIEKGEVIGVIGDNRPAPHIHFEIRVNQPDIPGPGYSWEDPQTVGWRSPRKFVTNWQGWLQPGYAWRVTLADEAGLSTPPLVLTDSSMLYLDGGALKRATADGRVLWRTILEKAAMSITGFEGAPMLTFADGTIQQVSFEGQLQGNRATGIAVDGAPLMAGESPIFHTPDDGLVLFDAGWREVLWRLEGVPPFIRGQVTAETIGLVTTDQEMVTISRDGQMLDRAQLREMASLATAPDGSLMVYGHGGLWSVDDSGTWDLLMEDAPPGGESGAALVGANGTLYLFDGAVLHAFDRDRVEQWQFSIPEVTGWTTLAHYGSILLLTSNHGHIISVRETGGVCNRAQIFGDDRMRAWHDLGDDGVLRVAVADQILGLDWQTFIGGCG